jgi:riboflavin kinase/FMN adenylyltransferase
MAVSGQPAIRQDHQVSVAPDGAKGGVIALGNFDGVHRGHQIVVKTAIEKARALGIPARVLTLEPHPRTVFNPDLPPFRLTPVAVKIRLLRALGIEDVIVQPFTAEFSQLSGQQFVEQIMLQSYGARHVVAGRDFVFGHGRGGNMENLRGWLMPHGVGVTEVLPFRDAQGLPMSSSRTREALRQGDLATVEHILGRPWSISGTIIPGEQRGRGIGVPTANIDLDDYIRPRLGVYAVLAGRIGETERYPGVANIGTRPTVYGQGERLEFHLFDFSRDIYDEAWEVELIDFLRPEQAFPDIETLRKQIYRDMETAKAKLRK